MHIHNLFGKINEDSWHAGDDAWSSDHDQWTKESAEVVPALTGVDEAGEIVTFKQNTDGDVKQVIQRPGAKTKVADVKEASGSTDPGDTIMLMSREFDRGVKAFKSKQYDTASEHINKINVYQQTLDLGPLGIDDDFMYRFHTRLENTCDLLEELSSNATRRAVAEVKDDLEKIGGRIDYLKMKFTRGQQGVAEGYRVVPGFDKEKYQERQGLEGPFHTKSGKVVYYDKKEGKYYDPDTDMYIEYDDWQAMNEQGVAEGEGESPEQLMQQAKKLENTAEYYWNQGGFEVAKEYYAKAEKLRQQAKGQQGVAEGMDDYTARLAAQQAAKKSAASAEADVYKQHGITARKLGGDDANSWAIFINGRVMINGLSKREVPYYKKEALKRAQQKQGVDEAIRDTIATGHKEDAERAKAQGDKLGFHNHMYHYHNRQSSLHGAERRATNPGSKSYERHAKLANNHLFSALKHKDKVKALGGEISGDDTQYDKAGAQAYASDFAKAAKAGMYTEARFEFDKSTGQMGLAKENPEDGRYGVYLDNRLFKTYWGKRAAENIMKQIKARNPDRHVEIKPFNDSDLNEAVNHDGRIQSLMIKKERLEIQMDRAKTQLAKVRDITKLIKYDDTMPAIIGQVTALIEGDKTFDQRELKWWQNGVEEARNALEAKVYEIEDTFNDVVRDLEYKIEELDLEMDEIEDQHTRDQQSGVVDEDAEQLNVGDPVIITGKGIQYEGSTGEIIDFGKDNRFVVVNLYNHGKHSFHSSDVSYNDYADSGDEEARMYDREPGMFTDTDESSNDFMAVDSTSPVGGKVAEGYYKKLKEDRDAKAHKKAYSMLGELKNILDK